MPQPHLCLVNSLRMWGGAEVWFLETALALKGRGHRVSVVAQPDSQLLKRCQRIGLETLPLAIRFDAAPWTLAKLTAYFRKQKVTAILANLTKDLKAAAVAGRLVQVPIILGTRESDFPLKDKFYYPWYFNKLATGLLVNSNATKATVLQSAPWLDPDKVHLLYKGIDLNKFCESENKCQNIIGFAGQFIERKGLHSLMKAWEIVEQTWSTREPSGKLATPQPKPHTQRPTLHLVGDGPMKPQLINWQKSLQHPDKVIIGELTENMPNFYQNISILVMPSRSEGFGLVAAEALACAVPVIATRTSSLPEIVTHEQTGLLVPVDDPQHLAGAINHLLADQSKIRQYGHAGRQFVQENFDRERTLDHLETLTGLGHSDI